ncbi:MAG: type II toxin-antitoxin system CcdA family antitoxin [Nitrospirota bacterium]|nr:type II toxin-antitoxin system CcdA family antitoxin [Nitrospirota bacterium]
MALTKTSITIPEDILSEAKKVSDNFSSLVAEALKEYLRKKNVEKAVSSFGKWKGREQSSVEMVNEMRKEERRRYADRAH